MNEARLRRCRGCSGYSLRERCPLCGQSTGTPHPARFSPQDRWARYRRALYEAASHGGAPAPLAEPGQEG
jgi:H/ACA ribonucleoprotein complex subunit 3